MLDGEDFEALDMVLLFVETFVDQVTVEKCGHPMKCLQTMLF